MTTEGLLLLLVVALIAALRGAGRGLTAATVAVRRRLVPWKQS